MDSLREWNLCLDSSYATRDNEKCNRKDDSRISDAKDRHPIYASSSSFRMLRFFRYDTSPHDISNSIISFTLVNYQEAKICTWFCHALFT